MPSSEERKLGVTLFNDIWKLIEKKDRTVDDQLAMIHIAHASAHHWLNAPEVTTQNRCISEWQCSRVYSILSMGQSALFHAQNCLRLAESDRVDDWVIASAHEAIARAAAALGDKTLYKRHFEAVSNLVRAIKDAEDRKQIESDLESEPWFGMKQS